MGSKNTYQLIKGMLCIQDKNKVQKVYVHYENNTRKIGMHAVIPDSIDFKTKLFDIYYIILCWISCHSYQMVNLLEKYNNYNMYQLRKIYNT